MFKTMYKLIKDKNKVKFIMYDKVWKWYENEEDMNVSLEKIYIKTISTVAYRILVDKRCQ